MRKLLIILAFVAIIASPSIAQNHTYYFTEVFSTVAPSFDASWTNQAKNPWTFASYSYTLPVDVTNTAMITLLRYSETDQYQQPVVSTSFWGKVETNQLWVVTNRITKVTTNVLFALQTSNAVSVVVDGTSIAQMYVLPFDVIQFSFETNASVTFDANK
jgi:hypothetical protein